MKVLVFQAAVSPIAIAAMGRLADELRREGHHAGLRSLPHFRREKEPADALIVALTPVEADRFKNLGTELVQVFGGDTDRILPLELPDDLEELQDFDFKAAVAKIEGPTAGFMDLAQLRSEAIERGLEVTAQTTREELEHMVGVDISSGPQAADRRTDRENADARLGTDRIGVRTSTVLPSANGLDLERMNDEQLRATAAQLNITFSPNIKRETLINRITKTFAAKVQAPADSAPKSPAEAVNADLAGKDEDALKAIATAESVDLGEATGVEAVTAKIVEARAEKDQGNG